MCCDSPFYSGNVLGKNGCLFKYDDVATFMDLVMVTGIILVSSRPVEIVLKILIIINEFLVTIMPFYFQKYSLFPKLFPTFVCFSN